MTAAGGECMRSEREVVVLGAGIAGLCAAYRLRGFDVEVVDAAAWLGGRTRSTVFADGTWANFGAQYLSADKSAVIDLADELGVALVPNGFAEAAERGRDALTPRESRDLEAAIARIEAQQANPRDPTLPELDDLTFAQWLHDEPVHVVRFLDQWCASVVCVSSAETSLYGALRLWGDQRRAAFTNERVRRSNRGDSVVVNGTQRLSEALAEASGAALSLETRAVSVASERGSYRVCVQSREGQRMIGATQVVVALPAPVAARVVRELPDWKRNALLAVRYGRFLCTPIRIAPANEARAPFPETWCRPRQVYNSNEFALRTPGDMDRDGGCFHSFVYDAYARQIWDDEDHTIKTGVVRALLDTYPQYAGRIRECAHRPLGAWVAGLLSGPHEASGGAGGVARRHPLLRRLRALREHRRRGAQRRSRGAPGTGPVANAHPRAAKRGRRPVSSPRGRGRGSRRPGRRMTRVTGAEALARTLQATGSTMSVWSLPGGDAGSPECEALTKSGGSAESVTGRDRPQARLAQFPEENRLSREKFSDFGMALRRAGTPLSSARAGRWRFRRRARDVDVQRGEIRPDTGLRVDGAKGLSRQSAIQIRSGRT